MGAEKLVFEWTEQTQKTIAAGVHRHDIAKAGTLVDYLAHSLGWIRPD
jgi:hypothetical protein